MSDAELYAMTEEEQLLALEKRIRDLEQWSAEHDGKITEKWVQQGRFNISCNTELSELHAIIDRKISAIMDEISSMKTKMAGVVGVATIAATMLAKYLLP